MEGIGKSDGPNSGESANSKLEDVLEGHRGEIDRLQRSTDNLRELNNRFYNLFSAGCSVMIGGALSSLALTAAHVNPELSHGVLYGALISGASILGLAFLYPTLYYSAPIGKKRRIEGLLNYGRKEQAETEHHIGEKGEITVTHYFAEDDNGWPAVMYAIDYTLPEINKMQNKISIAFTGKHFVTYLSTNTRFNTYSDMPRGFYGHGKTEEEALLESENMWDKKYGKKYSSYGNPFTEALSRLKDYHDPALFMHVDVGVGGRDPF